MRPHDSLFRTFLAALIAEDKPRCVALALDSLESGEIGLADLYTDVLAPALNGATADEPDAETAIWREHVRSGIVRTILECCYPILLRQIGHSNVGWRGTAVIVSPPEEYHEIGARMGSDFFNLCGYETVFVGSNTPRPTLIAGIRAVRPDCIVIHATNTYSLVHVKRIVSDLRALNPGLRIFGSGYAFRHDPGLCRELGVALIDSIADIRTLDASGALNGRALASAAADVPAATDSASAAASANGSASASADAKDSTDAAASVEEKGAGG